MKKAKKGELPAKNPLEPKHTSPRVKSTGYYKFKLVGELFLPPKKRHSVPGFTRIESLGTAVADLWVHGENNLGQRSGVRHSVL